MKRVFYCLIFFGNNTMDQTWRNYYVEYTLYSMDKILHSAIVYDLIEDFFNISFGKSQAYSLVLHLLAVEKSIEILQFNIFTCR